MYVCMYFNIYYFIIMLHSTFHLCILGPLEFGPKRVLQCFGAIFGRYNDSVACRSIYDEFMLLIMFDHASYLNSMGSKHPNDWWIHLSRSSQVPLTLYQVKNHMC